ncbi:hypothetical protein, partial [uncultured Duncaniella sp.]|uniref:hypothetical protein n=1 Tax=uncultured Duncaniella sp. TaxID=2768039 RepID=UPI0027322517
SRSFLNGDYIGASAELLLAKKRNGINISDTASATPAPNFNLSFPHPFFFCPAISIYRFRFIWAYIKPEPNQNLSHAQNQLSQ